MAFIVAELLLCHLIATSFTTKLLFIIYSFFFTIYIYIYINRLLTLHIHLCQVLTYIYISFLFPIYILLKAEAWHLLLLSSCCATSSPRHLPLNYYLLFIPLFYYNIYIYRLLTIYIHLCQF